MQSEFAIKSKRFQPISIAILVLIGVHVLWSASPGLVDIFLVQPSGYFSAWLAGADPVVDGHTMIFIALGLEVRVTEACSGAGFSSILVATIAYLLLVHRPRRGFTVIALIFIWPLVIAINTTRIVLSVASRRVAGLFLSPEYFPIVHQVTGTLVFLTALVALALLFNHLTRHGNQPATI